MNTKQEDNFRIRPELRCIAIQEAIWQQVKELAADNSRSVSSYIREVIKKEYKKLKNRDNALVG